MLASNQKIQIASLVNGACRFGAHHSWHVRTDWQPAAREQSARHLLAYAASWRHRTHALRLMAFNVPHYQAWLQSRPRFGSVRWYTCLSNFSVERDKLATNRAKSG